jgi:hypothetical protein
MIVIRFRTLALLLTATAIGSAIVGEIVMSWRIFG